MATAPLLSVIFVLIVTLIVSAAGRDTYNGPFDSWINVKTQFNAQGTGSVDDRAALQSALDLLDPQAFNSKTIYLPAGTYSISNTLTLNFAIDCLIIGEDPATTTIIYNGPNGGDLFRTNSVVGCRFERITWDGNNKAGNIINHLWDGSTGFGCSTLNHIDEVIKNGNIGINAGNNAGAQVSEVGVVRVQFLDLNQRGISLNNGNVLNWWIRDSTFDNTGRGVYASFAHFFIRDSIFTNNADGDALANQSNLFAIRQSTSKGSGDFANFNDNANFWGHVTLQRNLVEAENVTVSVYLQPPLVMMDNTLKTTGAGWPAYGTVANLIMVGENHQSVTNPGFRISVSNQENQLLIDNNFLATLPSVNIPSSPSNPPFVTTRTVFEPVNTTGEGVQAAIDAAFALNGQSPVVHLPFSTYGVSKTIVVPARFDVQIVGDGLVTKIAANSGFDGPVISFEGPSYATMTSVRVNGNDNNVLIEVQNADQSGSQIWMEDVLIRSPKKQGPVVELVVALLFLVGASFCGYWIIFHGSDSAELIRQAVLMFLLSLIPAVVAPITFFLWLWFIRSLRKDKVH